MRQRDRRKAQALAFLRLRHCASTFEIGSAAVQGERWSASKLTWKAKEQIGTAIAVTLTRRGVLRPTRGNQFTLVA
jgi:hypothetical protein